MSSYLSIYIKPKDINKKVLLTYYSRSSEVYQFFYENNLSVYGYSEGSETFKILTRDSLFGRIESLREDIMKLNKKLCLMKECKDKADIEDILSLQEYIDEQTDLLHSVEFINSLIPDEYTVTDVEAIYTNYD